MTTVEASKTVPPEVQATQLLFRLGLGYMVSAALQTVLQLEIADRLAGGARRVSDLAHEADVNEDALYRVLRTLASVGVFDEQAPRTFGLTAAGEFLRKGEGSFYDMGLFITSPFHFRAYAEMLYSVKTGLPGGERVAGKPLFEYFAENPDFSRLFNNAMTGFSANVVPAVLKVYDFTGIDTLVDVAGGHGQVLTSILQQYPKMRGVLLDVDHVIAGAQPLVDRAGVSDRCRTESGDFFRAVPAGGDAYIMKHIIHDWDDARATSILKNIRQALAGKPRGRVILIESVLQAGNAPDLGKLIDLEMLMLPGGRERTEDEFRALFAGAGFALTRVVPTESPLSVVEARVA